MGSSHHLFPLFHLQEVLLQHSYPELFDREELESQLHELTQLLQRFQFEDPVENARAFVLVEVPVLGREGLREQQMRKHFHLVILRAYPDEITEQRSAILFPKPIDPLAIA